MRNAIVTGGTRGLGLGICRALANSGYRVIVIARKDTSEFSAFRESANQAVPGCVHFASCDLIEISAIPNVVKTICAAHGPIYALVNNAGVSMEGSLALSSASEIERIVRLNTVSPIVLTKHAVRSMMAGGTGRIVNISSVTAFTGYSGLSVYAATKASMVGFTRSLAREVGRVGVTVNAVAPGFVETEMTNSMSEDQREKIKRRSALNRLVNVEDVGNAVEFFLSDRAKNITGTVMTVDAGNTA